MDQTTRQIVRALALGVNGLFAWIMLELIVSDRLKYYLNTAIFGWVVLVASILLAAMVLLRAGTWVAAKAGIVQDVAHDCCNHDHGHEHEHHAHTHEVSLWRLIVVALPLMLLMAGLVPNQLSAAGVANKMSTQQRLAAGMQLASLPPGRKVEGADVIRTTMSELAKAARDPSLRGWWESTDKPIAAKVIGQLIRMNSPGKYQLTRLQMSCCPGDATPVVILVAGDLTDDLRSEDWLEVVGPISYQQDPTGGFTPVLHQASVTKTTVPSEIYLK